ncbi:pyruvate dehydrogenase phosphatase regulatory subunit, mitochondrial-like isoform X2 [Daktulosphaira vitifoliae]|uniref:pyruvate dehydrogenase phosphatase regulatory subunit, mitochondrial-like isoform X2 n=1 Tax=Daktulosphaira vitifoliae TaxID=58002 RepID=UPI0021AA82C7|nr:pyruvate dehydrogenase phosphatase regulatory subunit, mitochondrial-like isoform X2 [Daktulosphaira vitifoliae]
MSLIMFLKKCHHRLILEKIIGRPSVICVSNFYRKNSKISHDSVLPTQAQIVICGTGLVANSLAYHLVENGWSDIVLVDQGKPCGGTSHFGSGTLGLFKPIAERNMIMYSIKLYRQLEAKGYDIGLKQCGSLNLAQTKNRMIALKRRIAYNSPSGLHCEMLGKNELKRLHPYLNTDDLEGGVWVPEDGVANPQAICKSLGKLASEGGAHYVSNCKVKKILTENNRIKGVNTSRGFIYCEYFVNCAGMWAREVGNLCSPKVRVPVYPAEHFYVTTNPLSGVNDDLPCLRDFDSHIYAREYNSGFLIGGFEKVAKPAFLNTALIPADWKKDMPQDWKHFMPYWEKAISRLPILKEVVNPLLSNSPDTFTPNGKWILGETPEVDNYFVAVGMNGNPLQGAGGIGKAMAEWIIEGRPTQEHLAFDVQRFLDLHNNRMYLQERTKEIIGRHYAIPYPHQNEYKNARKLRCSPLFSVLENRGAVFGTRMGYERPLYFDTTYNGKGKLPELPSGTFYKPTFFDFLLEEFYACRESVGIIDMSSFSKMNIQGGDIMTEFESQCDGVVEWLQSLCTNDVNIPVGGIVHTAMLNERGGYENDCLLVRERENSYLMVSPTSQQTRVLDWLKDHLPKDESIQLADITSMYTVVNVIGPKAGALISELSLSDVDINLQPFTFKTVNIGYASDVMMMAFTHTGEPGYCLYIPSEYALHVYDRLMAVGFDYGIRDVGSLAQRYMRIEKFIPFWAEELTRDTTPFEAGCNHIVKLDKEYFIGKFALRRQKDQGITKKLVMFILDELDPDTDIWLWGSEPIYRNGQFVGTITSAGYGFNLGKLVGLGYIQHTFSDNRNRNNISITNDYILSPSAKYEIDVAGNRFSASPKIHTPYISMNIQNMSDQSRYIPKIIC